MNNLIKLSKHIGERFDLVQAGGGNVSEKIGKNLFIKASGYHLSEVSEDKGIVAVENKLVTKILCDPSIKKLNKKDQETVVREKVKGISKSSARPSIELFMHSLFYKFTVHTHPLSVNTILCSSNAENVVKRLFPDALFVEYDTPGFFLTLKVKEKYDAYLNEFQKIPRVAFLQNHGMLVSDDTIEGILSIQEEILLKCERFLKIDFYKYRQTNLISALIRKVFDENLISYLSQDMCLLKYIKNSNGVNCTTPFFPDQLVYGGFRAVFINQIDDPTQVELYKNEFLEYPKIIVFNDDLFFIARNVKKAKDIEDVCKSHFIVANNCSNIIYLEKQELEFLANWEAEKFRRHI